MQASSPLKGWRSRFDLIGDSAEIAVVGAEIQLSAPILWCLSPSLQSYFRSYNPR